MSHTVIIIQQKILPPPDAQQAATETSGEMTAEITFVPPHTMTDAQIGNAVERIVRRLTKLADD